MIPVRLLVLGAMLGALYGCAGSSTTTPTTTTKPAAQAESWSMARVSFDALSGWNSSSAGAALQSFRRSCAVLAKRADDAALSGVGYAGTAADWRGVCAGAGGDAKAFFAANFTPYALSAPGDGLFTGYYEPEIRGSRTRQGAYQTPVHGMPSDLVRVDLGQFIPKLKGERVSGRVSGNTLVPYANRKEINAATKAPVLFYTDDAVALFFLQIQGSGRVVFTDGKMGRIGYAGENGRPYTAIGRTLIAENALTRENVSLQTIRAWLLANPARAQGVMEGNESYIFFEEKPLGDAALGATGSLGVALTPGASLAVDPRIHALGAPFYLDAGGPDPVQGLLVAQDIGGAIRGSVRGDIFFGFGPDAERRAGAMKAPGRLYVLLPNAVAARIGAGKTFTP
jgi:membrane-bound lytic murein transglycosylase A